MNNEKIAVLIVEDEIFAAKYLEKLLNSLNFKIVFKAANAKDALEIAKISNIDLAFMDININGAIDGIECSKILNEQYSIPIIYTTAYGDSQTIKEASDTNFYGYLVKPFEKHDLEATLRVALKMLKPKEEPLTVSQTDKQLVELGEEQKFNLSTNTLLIDDTPVNLTNKETILLAFFCTNMNQNISYDTLKQEVWHNEDISNSTIRDTIARLKKKVPKLHLENIVSHGYVLKR